MKRGSHPHIALIACALLGWNASVWTQLLAGPPPSEFGSIETPRRVCNLVEKACGDYVLPLVHETTRPPLTWQGNARSVIEFIQPDDIESACRSGENVTACTRMLPGRPTIIMPNPCAFPWDAYAALLCHEMAHVNGWEHQREGAL